MPRATGISVMLLLMVSTAGWCWLRPGTNWVELIDEAELIAVAHLAGPPIVSREERQSGDSTVVNDEFRCRLVIDEVLMGEAPGREVPVTLHHGLDAYPSTIGGDLVDRGWEPVVGGVEGMEIAIWDTGSSAASFDPLLADAGEPGIWVLAHYTDRVRRSGGPTEDLSIREPGHLYSIDMLPLFRAIVDGDTDAIRALLDDPDERVRRHCVRYLADTEKAREASTVSPPVAGDDGDEERRSSLAVVGLIGVALVALVAVGVALALWRRHRASVGQKADSR